jgi:hypothetical protein
LPAAHQVAGRPRAAQAIEGGRQEERDRRREADGGQQQAGHHEVVVGQRDAQRQGSDAQVGGDQTRAADLAQQAALAGMGGRVTRADGRHDVGGRGQHGKAGPAWDQGAKEDRGAGSHRIGAGHEQPQRGQQGSDLEPGDGAHEAAHGEAMPAFVATPG